jgi:methyl-accepting chemotaxis protein
LNGWQISFAIAAAVEEQGAATQEISRNVQQSLAEPAGFFQHLDVQRGASETGAASCRCLAAQSMSGDSHRPA